ncbi:MAG TPA: hypothetical protein VHB79_26725 [Polyangiaceae bacterium]|nr:hypothetical protein [Polyangiaceae bacterium]
MAFVRLAEPNKKPGLYYAVTDDGLELPVVDVSHPSFALALDAEAQQKLCRRFMAEQERFRKLPRWIGMALMRFVLRGSRLARGLRRADGTFLDGMTTYLFKLGPNNLGPYAVPIDRRLVSSLPAVSMRLRLSDMAQLLADGLAPRLSAERSRPLHLLNIAGGPAVDSLNALLLLEREHAGLLAGREVRLRVLDGDEQGPTFGARALAALQRSGAPLAAVKATFEHVPYDWSTPEGELARVLHEAEQAGAIVAVSSEGGLFEYGSDEHILANLRVLAGAHDSELFAVGSVTRNDELMKFVKQTSNAATIPRGLATFRALVAQAGFRIAQCIERPMSDQVVLRTA